MRAGTYFRYVTTGCVTGVVSCVIPWSSSSPRKEGCDRVKVAKGFLFSKRRQLSPEAEEQEERREAAC